MNENEIQSEEWRPICGYEGLYEVSSLGRVKSLANEFLRKEKILKFGKMKNGYLYVNLCKEGKMKNCTVHRLVANAFIENTNNFKCVNHKDECKTNNCVNNLEWCTYQYNNTYRNFQQRRVANTDWKSVAEKKSKKVYQYSLDGTLVAIWESIAECGRNGFNQGNVSACCNGERNTHRGYIWSYQELKKQEN